MEIKIGFRFSKQHESLGRKYWKTYEVVGSSYGWYYAAGNALVLTSIPNQVVGTENNISTAVVATTTANVFTFGITNNSGSSQVVNYGYTKL